MTRLRAGTRGSDLALWQTRWVCDLLRRSHAGVEIEEVIIQTHGDVAKDQRFDADWPVGGFVGALEQALARRDIDFATHSYKDLQTAVTAGLAIAAVPVREAVYDVLVTDREVDLDALPAGFRVGTSSPRRSAQFRRLGDVRIVAIRGNVPTRVGKVDGGDVDGVILAAAGLKRLGIEPAFVTPLPVERFVPAPAQGALAIQTRDEVELMAMLGAINDADTRRSVEAERSFLAAIGAGCHTPVGALATLNGDSVSLDAQLFSDDGVHEVRGTETGTDAGQVGRVLADRLLGELKGVM